MNAWRYRGGRNPGDPRGERGQAILFGAVSLLLLAFLIGMVYNVGRAAQHRVQVQLAADVGVYTAANIQANALSTIAWINSGMAQVYYNAMRYAIDVDVTGVGAWYEYKQTNGPGPAFDEYKQAYVRAMENMKNARQLMLDLSRVENAIALVTPAQMLQEVSNAVTSIGAERYSFFPSVRLFPSGASNQSWGIQQFGNGWRIWNIVGGDSSQVAVFKETDDQGRRRWRIEYSKGDTTQETVLITEITPDKEWDIRRLDGSGALVQQITITDTGDPNLGWVVAGSQPNNPSAPPIRLSFLPADMDEDGANEGTTVSYGGQSYTFKREGGNVYIWSVTNKDYLSLTYDETTIGGVKVRVHVDQTIRFPGATVHVGSPVSVDIGACHLVLTDPPHIDTGVGPIHVGIHGFDANDFSISVGGFNINVGTADGRWRTYGNPHEGTLWRHRLTEEPPQDGADRQWRYDWEALGANLKYETNVDRFVVYHAIRDHIGDSAAMPEWTNWFDYTPAQARPKNNGADYSMSGTCQHCNGSGADPVTGRQCTYCNGQDLNGDGMTDIRVTLQDLASTAFKQYRNQYLTVTPPPGVAAGFQDDDYADARIFWSGSPYGVAGQPRMPLVLTEEFFKYGINVAAYRYPVTVPMIFSREPDWGFVALASARVAIPVDNQPSPQYLYRFADLPGIPQDPSKYDDVRQEAVETGNWNLYNPRIEARLVATADNVNTYDLEHDMTNALTAIDENGLSYLVSTIMTMRYSSTYNETGWIDRYDGHSDPEVTQRLGHMNDRQGRNFQLYSPQLSNLVEH